MQNIRQRKDLKNNQQKRADCLQRHGNYFEGRFPISNKKCRKQQNNNLQRAEEIRYVNHEFYTQLKYHSV